MPAPATTPVDASVEPVVFDTSFEALFRRAMPQHVDDALRAGLRGMGLDLAKLQPAYPPGTWGRALQLLAHKAFPHLSEDEAHFEMGCAYMRGLKETVVGGALFTLGRVIGPKRMLARMTRNSRTANNYLEFWMEEEADGSLCYHARVMPALVPKLRGHQRPPPGYVRGIVHSTIVFCGGADPQVTVETLDEETMHTVYRVRFRS